MDSPWFALTSTTDFDKQCVEQRTGCYVYKFEFKQFQNSSYAKETEATTETSSKRKKETTMIASSVKIVLASLLVLSMAVTISAQVCPNDYIVLPLANGAENPSRRLQEGAPPIQVIEQGGSYVDFVVQSSSAFMIEPEHLFVQYESGEFFSDNCLMFEGLELGEASTVMRASCVAGEYAVVWVHARSFTTLGLGSFEIPQCCPDPYGDSIPTSASTMKFAYELRCVPSCDDPVDNVSGAPSSSPSALPTELKLPRRALQEEIIKDMMPPSSSLCSPQTSTSTFEYQSSQAESQWYAPFAPLEEELFLAKMQHIDNNFNRSWTIRFGQAGNIYSMVGPMGETVPPQEHTNAPWVDEVWQAVQPLGPNGDHDNDLNTGPYFIHEAGTYTRDAPYTDKPFYSPTLGSYCNDGEGECGFASWVRNTSSGTNKRKFRFNCEKLTAPLCSFLFLVVSIFNRVNKRMFQHSGRVRCCI